MMHFLTAAAGNSVHHHVSKLFFQLGQLLSESPISTEYHSDVSLVILLISLLGSAKGGNGSFG